MKIEFEGTVIPEQYGEKPYNARLKGRIEGGQIIIDEVEPV